MSGVHRRQELEAKLNDAVELSKTLSPPLAPDTVTVYDFTAQQAYNGATKDLQVDSVNDEVRCVFACSHSCAIAPAPCPGVCVCVTVVVG